VTLVFVVVSLVLNYKFHIADQVIYSQPDGFDKLVRWIGFMAFPYLVVIGIQVIFQKPAEGLRKWGFWGMLLMGLLMVSVTAWFPWHKTLARTLFPRELMRWGFLVLWNLKRVAFMLVPLLVFWWWTERRRGGAKGNEKLGKSDLQSSDLGEPTHFYGFFTRPRNLQPYFLMLLIMLPLIIVASFQPDFLKHYPQYYAGKGEAKIGVSPWLTGAIFELVYGADFALVELVFRGFLVIGFVKWLGPRAILPMAAMYCFLHFGKPAGEAASSFVGGYILGVVAYYSRSIWGGIVVHMGIAWMMEAAAYIQRGLQ
jgi:hypothetical protein